MGGLDIIHQHDYIASSLACQLGPVPYVFTNHSSYFLHEIQAGRGRSYARLGQRGMKLIIAPSPELAEESARTWGAGVPVHYVPNGVDPSAFTPTTSSFGTGRLTILCPRRMDPKNGVIYLVRAYLEACATDPLFRDTTLVVTGSATGGEHRSYDAEVRELAASSAFSSQIQFVGNVPAQEMARLYASAQIVCIPSLVEAVSLAALEAMACGLPVVASAVGGLPEVVLPGRTGELVPPADPVALTRALTKLVASARLRAEYGAAGRELVVSQYTWTHVAEATYELYARAIGRRS
jgi:glycosyltransferase involved in cell wall biosynthesis